MEKRKRITQYALLFLVCMACCLVSSVTAQAEDRTTGLFVKDDIGFVWNGELDRDVPYLNEGAVSSTGTGASLNGDTWRTVLYFEYVATEEGDPVNVMSDDIAAVQFQAPGEESPNPAEESEVTWNAHPGDGTFVEFDFKKVGTYTVTYNESSVTIDVNFPVIGFYRSSDVTEENFREKFIEDMPYERKIGADEFYAVAFPQEDWQSFTYDVVLEDTYDTNADSYVKVEDVGDGTKKVTITDKAKCGFNLKAKGTITYNDGKEDEYRYPEVNIWCHDDYDVPVMEDDAEYTGFSGLFISEKAYNEKSSRDEGADFNYWVHADTLQGVIDKLAKAVGTTVQDDEGNSYKVANTGYIWLNVSYYPNNEKYEANARKPQTITDTKGCKIALVSDSNPYYIFDAEGNRMGSVDKWVKGSECKYTFYDWDEETKTTCLKEVTGSPEDGFVVTDTVVTESALESAGWERDWYGVGHELPTLHWKAGGEVTVVDNIFMENSDANIYLYNSKSSFSICNWDDNGNIISIKKVNADTFAKTNKTTVNGVTLKYEVVPTGIRIVTAPTKTVYTTGEAFDKSGMAVELVYSDGSTKKITDYTVPATALTEADTAVTVTYGSYTAKQAITVNPVPAAPVTPTPAPTTPTTPTDTTKVGDVTTVDGGSFTVTSVADGTKAVTYTGTDKKATKAAIPATVTIGGVTYQVTAIADNSFSGNKKLKSVTIPETIVTVGSGAFKGCTKLKKVTLPKNVEVIGKNAFSGCKNLKTITIKSTSVTTIGKNAFKNVNKNVTVKVPKSKKKEYKKLLKKAGYKKTVK